MCQADKGYLACPSKGLRTSALVDKSWWLLTLCFLCPQRTHIVHCIRSQFCFSWNFLTDFPEDMFKNMYALRELRLSDNYLQRLPSKVWMPIWNQLTILSLTGAHSSFAPYLEHTIATDRIRTTESVFWKPGPQQALRALHRTLAACACLGCTRCWSCQM